MPTPFPTGGATDAKTAFTPARPAVNYLRRITSALLIVASVLLLGSSVYRAATFPFTHDESLSFAIFHWEPAFRGTANNHLLNTFCMHWCSILLGDSALALRLPTLLAHALYLLCVLLLLKRFRHPAFQLAGFALLNLNPFLLDFFFLARGYGQALALQMASLYLLTRAYQAKQQLRPFAMYLCLGALAGSLAVLANYAFLNYYLPLLLASEWLFVTDDSLRRFSTKHIGPSIPLFTVCGIFLAFVFVKMLQLQRGGQFFFGGHDGFVKDTVGSLVRCSLYLANYSNGTDQIVSAIVIGSFAMVCIVGLCLSFRKRPIPLIALFLVILASAAVLPCLQHRLGGSLFPIERAALCYVPLYGVVLLFAFQAITPHLSCRWDRMAVFSVPLALAVALTWHFCGSFNSHACYSWGYDRHDDEILELVNRDHERNFPGRIVKMGNSANMEPSLNFYRITRDYTWLATLTRNPLSVGDNDYLYALESDLTAIPMVHQVRLACFADTQTVLVRVDRSTGE
jgi:hypothetical protein